MSIESARQFYRDLRSHPDMRKDLDASALAALQEYVKKQGYDFTRQELEQATEEILAASQAGELDDKDLERVAGGAGNMSTTEWLSLMAGANALGPAASIVTILTVSNTMKDRLEQGKE